MARSEPESDLMRDATGLVRRVELDWPGDDRPLVAGFRRDEVLSFYFGESPVYQFDADGRLRRAFLDPDRYRTQGNTLARAGSSSTVTTLTPTRSRNSIEPCVRGSSDCPNRSTPKR